MGSGGQEEKTMKKPESHDNQEVRGVHWVGKNSRLSVSEKVAIALILAVLMLVARGYAPELLKALANLSGK